MNPTKRTLSGEKVSPTQTHKRIFLSKHTSYDDALAAKNREDRYPYHQLQIRRRVNRFDLVARVPMKENN